MPGEPASEPLAEREVEVRFWRLDTGPPDKPRFRPRAPDPAAGRPRYAAHGHERWPLATLTAFLFDGRECDDVRALLAAGEASSTLGRITWDPVVLSAEELSAVEQTFPRPLPEAERGLNLRLASDVRLVVPAERPVAQATLAQAAAPVRRAASRAEYLRFDYGPWADLWVATVTPDGVAPLTGAVPVGGLRGGSALAARLGRERPASLTERLSAAGELAGAEAEQLARTLWTDVLDWHRELLTEGARQMGAALRITVPRARLGPPWPYPRTPWRPRP